MGGWEGAYVGVLVCVGMGILVWICGVVPLILSYCMCSAGKPVVAFLCGDLNSSPECGVYQSVQKSGFASAYHSVHHHEPAVTHRDHRGNSVAADYVFYRWHLHLMQCSSDVVYMAVRVTWSGACD